MVTETVVEQVVKALGRGVPIAEVARAFALDRKTVRTWGRRGAYVPRAGRPAVLRFDPYRDWMEKRASEVDYNAAVLHRELTDQGFEGSVIIVRWAVRALRQAAAPPQRTARSPATTGMSRRSAPGSPARGRLARSNSRARPSC